MTTPPMPNEPPPRLVLPTPAQFAATIAELRERADALTRRADWGGPHVAECRTHADALTAVADWLAAPIPSPHPSGTP